MTALSTALAGWLGFVGPWGALAVFATVGLVVLPGLEYGWRLVWASRVIALEENQRLRERVNVLEGQEGDRDLRLEVNVSHVSIARCLEPPPKGSVATRMEWVIVTVWGLDVTNSEDHDVRLTVEANIPLEKKRITDGKRFIPTDERNWFPAKRPPTHLATPWPIPAHHGVHGNLGIAIDVMTTLVSSGFKNIKADYIDLTFKDLVHGRTVGKRLRSVVKDEDLLNPKVYFRGPFYDDE